MQPIVLNQSGQFAIIASNEKLVNVLNIRNFHDELSGVEQIIKEFSWSKDNEVWSYWSILNQENLEALADKNLLPKTGFYFRFRYTLTTIGNITILDASVDIEYDIVDKDKGYVPYGFKRGNMNCVDCGSMRGQILNMCTASFNPYLVNPAVDIYKDICYSVQNMFGQQVMYLRATPKQNSGDVVFKEWTLYDVEEAVCTKVLVPNNEFPDAKLNYNPYDIDYETPFEVHIVKQNFEEAFGVEAAPQSRDVIFFPFMPNRLYEVKSSTPHRDFMMQIAYWKVDLMKWKSKSDTYPTENISKMLDEITVDSYEAMGKEFKKEVDNITKPQQYDRLIGTNLKDPIRKYINLDMNILSVPIKNHATTISEHHYDLSSIFKIDKQQVGIQYAIRSNFKADDNFAFSCWFKDTKIKFNLPEDSAKIISVIGNVVTVKLQGKRNYTYGCNLQIARQGSLNFYGQVTNVIDSSTFELTVPQDIIDFLGQINVNWSTSPGWFSRQCFEKIYIDGLALIGTPSEWKGWKISSFAERYFIININGKETYICLPENLTNDWFGLFFNYSSDFSQINFSIWKIKTTRHETTELDIVYTKTLDDIVKEDKNNNLEYNLISSNMLLTNIRIFNDTVEYEKQSPILNQIIVKDSHQLILADNAYPLQHLSYVGNTK